MNFEQAYDPVRCLRASWELLKRAPATILLGALVPIVFQGALGFGMELLLIPMIFASGQPRPGEIPAFFPVFVAMAAVLGLFLFVFQTWIDIGYARAVREVQTQGTEPFATIFRGGDRLLRLLLARFLTSLVFLAGYAAGAIVLVSAGLLGAHAAPTPMMVTVLICAAFVSWCVGIYLTLGFQFVTQIVAFED